MRLQSYALSIHHFISSVGADAGFASIIGLAVLVLLYFAQARETASLREQAELAAQRVAQLESRLNHTVVAQPQVAPPPSGIAPLPGMQRPGGPPGAGVPRPGGISAPGMQRSPGGIAAAGAQQPGGIAAAGAQQPGGIAAAGVHQPGGIAAAGMQQPAPAAAAAGGPAPPAGVAAPPLSAATKLIPTPPVQPPTIAAPGVAAARIGTPAGARSPVVTAPAVAASSAPPGTSPPTSIPPGNRIVTPRPATAAGGANATNGTGEYGLVPPPAPVPPFPARSTATATAAPPILSDFDDREGGGRSNDLARVLTVVAAVAVLAAIVVVLITLTSGGSSPRTTSQPSPVSNAPKPHRAKPKTASTAVNPASVTVAVLNGTPTAGLAKSVATQLGAAGYQQGTVANAATQTQPTTTVAYLPGDQRDAAAVARSLKLAASSVQAIDPNTQALACPQATACTAKVVVVLGADQSNTQTQTTG